MILPFKKYLWHPVDPDRSNSGFLSLVCGMVLKVGVMYFSMTRKSSWDLWIDRNLIAARFFPNNLSLTSIWTINALSLNFLLAYRQINGKKKSAIWNRHLVPNYQNPMLVVKLNRKNIVILFVFKSTNIHLYIWCENSCKLIFINVRIMYLSVNLAE